MTARDAVEIVTLRADNARLTAELATVLEELTTTREVMRGTIVDINDRLNACLAERDTLRAALLGLVDAVSTAEGVGRAIGVVSGQLTPWHEREFWTAMRRAFDAKNAAVALLDGAKEGR